MDLFRDILPSILQTKKPVLDDEKDYVPYVINRSLSFHDDCIMFANEMNRNPHLDRRLQYDYFINILRAWKRPFRRWQKLEKNDDLELIKEYYGYSNEKAKAALALLTESQLDTIRRSKGGFNHGHKQSSRGDA